MKFEPEEGKNSKKRGISLNSAVLYRFVLVLTALLEVHDRGGIALSLSRISEGREDGESW